MVLNDKWAGTVARRVLSEVNNLTLALVSRIQQLGERYSDTLEDLDADVAKFADRVAEHLADMGVK